MADILFVIFVVALLALAIGFIIYFIDLLISDYIRKKGYQNSILEPLKKTIDKGRLTNLKDVFSIIESSRVEPYSNNPEKYIEEVLSDLRTYKLTKDDSVYGFDSRLFDNLSKELEQRKQTEPFEGLPSNERDLLKDILQITNLSGSNSSHLKSKIHSLSDIMITKERNIQIVGVENKISYRLSIISLIIGVISMVLTVISLIKGWN